MKFIDIGEGAKIGELTMTKNIVVVDDISKIETFVSIGKNGEITTVNADGNEVHTPDSYAKKLKKEREDLFSQIKDMRAVIETIPDDFAKQKIKKALREAEDQPLNQQGERQVKNILGEVLKISKDVGAAVLAAVITSYIGYMPSL
ncbi:hypothetical protein C9I50_18360 [Pseudomonas prosekii]|uniref:hypothetical protein n=1 Tax=Pseudomonas prosekii TaxID=1148509 RepID=UPI000D60BC57|nr:hypothetical protein [Pseudomonas prosekii]PWE39630.1 hypothetical protein C9I50_18360 [Pseudomonas prosekii]